MSRLVLHAPVSGTLVPLDEVPDPVFAQRMVGDGVSIAPTSSVLVAPCAGRVAHVHGARHAITITTDEGLEVMLHVGLDTVKLNGEGFTAHVAEGDRVSTGERLLEFDLAIVTRQACSLLTQIVITNGERVAAMTPHTGTVVAGRDVVLEIDVREANAPTGPVVVTLSSAPIRITNASGLHVRPAAALSRAVRALAADIAIVCADGRAADARSVVSLMALEVVPGDDVVVRATGRDAERAIATLPGLLASALGDGTPADLPIDDAGRPSIAADVDARVADDGERLVGAATSPGVAVGRVFQWRHEPIDVANAGTGVRTERRALEAAIDHARAQLRELSRRLEADADPGKSAIVAAHEALLDDPDIVDAADDAIAQGMSAAWAWSRAVDAQATRLARLRHTVFAARAGDVRDVGRRVLRLLTSRGRVRPHVPEQAILVTDELAPSEVIGLDRARVLGICTTSGGASSHVAILARSLEIPMVTAVDAVALDLPDGTPVLLDGSAGSLRLQPTDRDVAEAHARQAAHAAARDVELVSASTPATTRDGHRVEVVANIGSVAEAGRILALGGEGVGLLRTEFLFLDRLTAPTEDEQAETYSAIARLLGPGQRLVIRTLDAGGDKSLPCVPMAREDNPFLGVRGIRALLDRPELLRTQLRAILRASGVASVHVMFPMVATIGEWRAAKAMLDAERDALGVAAIPAGIMIEVPAAAIMADAFAREADFLSIGTNDLAQYALAMDRRHPRLAPRVDDLDPAVLQLIAHTVASAHAHGKWVGVCGDSAGDAGAIPVLLGLGVDELSVSVPSLPAVKSCVRGLDHAACRELAARALEALTASDVRALTLGG